MNNLDIRVKIKPSNKYYVGTVYLGGKKLDHAIHHNAVDLATHIAAKTNAHIKIFKYDTR